MNLAMPTMLSWVLGGNLNVFKTSDRKPICYLCDKPKHFDEQVHRCYHPIQLVSKKLTICQIAKTFSQRHNTVNI